MVGAVRLVRRLPVWLLRRRSDAFREAKSETWSRVSARGLAGRARSVLQSDVRELLRRCSQPVLAIAFADDRVVDYDYVAEIAKHRAGARVVTVPGGHMGLFTHPKEPVAEILRFIHADGGRRRAPLNQPSQHYA
jgi:pimeloyl-ACP methyl ester carboxylesterase